MSASLEPIAAPHAHDRYSVPWIMGQVCYALLPITAFAFYLFGWPAIVLWILSCATALACEYLCLLARGQSPASLFDGSALLTGWLLALCLPPWAPWWIAVLGSGFAIAVGKHLYGGVGQNLFNPAMLARTALLISFPVPMTTWVVVNPITSPSAPGLLESLGIVFGGVEASDGLTGATRLGGLKTGLSQDLGVTELLSRAAPDAAAFSGTIAGSAGETSALLILLGGLWLLWRRVITWHIPLAMLTSVAVLAGLFHGIDPERYAGPGFHLLSGGLMLGAFFIATDLVTSPASKLGQLIFGGGCGALTYLIRTWGGYPEAVAFAVLMMNALTPLLDQYCRPRIYGHGRRHRKGLEAVTPTAMANAAPEPTPVSSVEAVGSEK